MDTDAKAGLGMAMGPAPALAGVQILDARRRKKEKVYVAVLDGVLTPDECAACIAATEDLGYAKALVNYNGTGEQVYMPQSRKHDRVMVDDVPFAEAILERVRAHLPAEHRGAKLTGINPRARFLRYHPGDFFARHTDGVYTSEDRTQKSRITLQLYLNDVTDGGETTFFGLRVGGVNHDSYRVEPKAGRVLLFSHNIPHEGSLLTTGVKYAMRTDIMYEAGAAHA